MTVTELEPDYKAALVEILTSDEWVRVSRDDVEIDGMFSGPALRKALTKLIEEGIVRDRYDS